MLEKMFYPKSIAIVGASNTPGKVGYSVVQNLIEANFSGPIYPVNLKEEKILGLESFPSITKINKIIDLVIIVVPAKFVLSIIEECAKKGIKNVVIITAGFSETGEEGKK